MEPTFDFPDIGLVRRRDLPISDGAVTRAVRAGRLRRLYPDVYATADCLLDPAAARRRGALVYAGTGARLSCVSACAEWDLEHSAAAKVHVTTAKWQVRPVALLVPHRSSRWPATSTGDVPVSALDHAIVEAFGCLSRSAGRSLLIAAVSGGRVQPEDIRAAAERGIRARPALLALLDDVETGSHSEGELALLALIRNAGLPEPKRQLRVRVGARSAYLDMAFSPQRVAIEADSRRWHFSAESRTADIRRDALLSAAGWVVLRFLYEQIVNEPRWVAEQIRATLAARTPTP